MAKIKHGEQIFTPEMIRTLETVLANELRNDDGSTDHRLMISDLRITINTVKVLQRAAVYVQEEGKHE